jgi:hypothetical protein
MQHGGAGGPSSALKALPLAKRGICEYSWPLVASSTWMFLALEPLSTTWFATTAGTTRFRARAGRGFRA